MGSPATPCGASLWRSRTGNKWYEDDFKRKGEREGLIEGGGKKFCGWKRD